MTARNPFHLPFAPHSFEITALTPADHAALGRQLESAAYRHVHLDWQVLPELLASPDFRSRVAREGGRIRALIGATIHTSPYSPQRVAWLRLILPSDSPRHDDALDLAWQALSAALRAEGVSHVGLLSLDPWIESPAARWGFARTNAVITLRRESGPLPEPPAAPFAIRDVSLADLPDVANLDAMAFAPIWHHNRETLAAASRQAATFTRLDEGPAIAGYQLSTWHMDTGHLARLAIRPDLHGRGLGAALVGGMLRFFQERGVRIITVNTQADNMSSQRLYHKLGFQASGHSVSYWSIDLR